jgi:hypothetical protein
MVTAMGSARRPERRRPGRAEHPASAALIESAAVNARNDDVMTRGDLFHGLSYRSLQGRCCSEHIHTRGDLLGIGLLHGLGRAQQHGRIREAALIAVPDNAAALSCLIGGRPSNRFARPRGLEPGDRDLHIEPRHGLGLALFDRSTRRLLARFSEPCLVGKTMEQVDPATAPATQLDDREFQAPPFSSHAPCAATCGRNAACAASTVAAASCSCCMASATSGRFFNASSSRPAGLVMSMAIAGGVRSSENIVLKGSPIN